MHIGAIHLLGHSFPPDVRIEKESRSLIKYGHKVTVVTEKTIPEQNNYENYDNNFYIKRVKLDNMDRLDDLLSRFTLYYKNCIPHLIKFIESYKPDVLHVHDFTLVPTVLKTTRKYNIPVIADLHENMPAALVASRSEDSFLIKSIRKISLNYHLWRWHESNALPKCIKILVVVPEAAERLLDYGISQDKIIVVSNTEDETTFGHSSEKADPDILEKYKNYWVASYIGGLGPHRGIDTTLRMLTLIGDKIDNFKLLIVGANKHQIDILHKKAERLGVKNKVEVTGWQPFDKVQSYIMASNVCLVPHNDFEHTNTTVPHKLFQYMICAKPVLVSTCRPLKRIVEDCQSGLVFKANDPKDMANKLVAMYQNKKATVKMSENGRLAALGKYAWRNDANRLQKMYSEIEECMRKNKVNI